jgi:EAL domain-containing protein (putative c-di-GMP-specific phosphodiesterase class I)
MYGAKAGLGEGVNFYDVGSDTNTPRRLALANDLGSALTNGELRLVYQPKVRLRDGVVTGYESLARWSHPLFGEIGPDEFIPLAERTGMIQQLTEHVLSVALHQAKDWQRDGVGGGIAVNLSMRNLLDSDLVGTVERLLADSGANPALLTLEITETNVMSDPSRTIAVLERLAGLGLRLSVDDFGTGYSSLSYLQRLPVHEVKIDKLFVLAMSTDPNAEAIVRSVLDLARNMHLSVVAEGVEDRETWDRLQELGCSEAQGYYLARPMPPVDVPGCAHRLAQLQLVASDETDRRSIGRSSRSLAGHPS